MAKYYIIGAEPNKHALSSREFFSEVKTLVENHNKNAGRTGADEKWRMHKSIARDLMERLDPVAGYGFFEELFDSETQLTLYQMRDDVVDEELQAFISAVPDSLSKEDRAKFAKSKWGSKTHLFLTAEDKRRINLAIMEHGLSEPNGARQLEPVRASWKYDDPLSC